MDTQLAPIAPKSLSTAQFAALSAIPPEAEWCANLRNRPTRENYQRDIRQFIAFAGLGSAEQLREVTRPHVLAWRDHPHRGGHFITTRHASKRSTAHWGLCSSNGTLIWRSKRCLTRLNPQPLHALHDGGYITSGERVSLGILTIQNRPDQRPWAVPGCRRDWERVRRSSSATASTRLMPHVASAEALKSSTRSGGTTINASMIVRGTCICCA